MVVCMASSIPVEAAAAAAAAAAAVGGRPEYVAQRLAYCESAECKRCFMRHHPVLMAGLIVTKGTKKDRINIIKNF